MAPWPIYQAAEDTLLARRRAQRGAPTLGDDADQALVLALSQLPPAAAPLARESGLRLGSHVYSRRYHDDALPRGLAILSESLASSGLGTLEIEHTFHRSARVRFMPSIPAAAAASAIRSAFLAGVLEGYASEAFNCEAAVKPADADVLELDLGTGRDVNRRAGE